MRSRVISKKYLLDELERLTQRHKESTLVQEKTSIEGSILTVRQMLLFMEGRTRVK